MDTWQPSTLSWSFSRKTHFDSCRRHYFHHRFWGQDAKLRWRLYEMRNLITLMMLRGQVVHSVIAGALDSIRQGRKIDTKTVKGEVTRIIRERWFESAKRLWHIDNRPPGRKQGEFTSLLEHYYGFPDTNERAKEAQQTAWKSVENLVESDFWSAIVESDHTGWREIEAGGFPHFDLDGIQVYATIDFAHSNSSPTIIDWKTGAESANDRSQLIVYSLYAQSKWSWDPLETKLAAVYLQPELHVEPFTPTREEIDLAIETVKRSFNEMLELEPPHGPANIDDFPQTGGISDCAWCRFRGICEGAKQDAS